MIRAIADCIMFRRARKLTELLLPFLPDVGLIADVGSGTGHNAVFLRKHTKCEIVQLDVADMHWVGERPQMISNESETLGFTGDQVHCSLLIYVLQYPEDPSLLLKQILNSGIQQVLVLQSTYRNQRGKYAFRIQEALCGPIAFYLAVLFRLIPREKCSVKPVRYFCSDDVIDLLNRSGLNVSHHHSESNWLIGTGADLFVCRKEVA